MWLCVLKKCYQLHFCICKTNVFVYVAVCVHVQPLGVAACVISYVGILRMAVCDISYVVVSVAV